LLEGVGEVEKVGLAKGGEGIERIEKIIWVKRGRRKRRYRAKRK
jgi:hypothetical protein